MNYESGYYWARVKDKTFENKTKPWQIMELVTTCRGNSIMINIQQHMYSYHINECEVGPKIEPPTET